MNERTSVFGSAEPAASGDPRPVGELSGLHVAFDRRGERVEALRGVDLSIAPGEIVGLVGESGSGKTVLGLSLLGLLPETAAVRGRALVDGVDMVTASPAAARKLRREALGAVFQDPMSSLNPTTRVGPQLLEVARGTPEALRLLEAVGVPEAARRMRQYPHELSGGLRQRVMLAIALAGDPRLVIADEPTTALDVTVQAQVLRLFREVRERFSCAIVLVTHDLAVASAVADRICVMYAGRVVELGRTADTLGAPAHPYTGALRSARVALDADRAVQLPMLPGEPPDPRRDPPGCSFAPRCPKAAALCRDNRPALVPTPRHGGLSACHFSADTDMERALPRRSWPGAGASRGGARVRDLWVDFPVRGALRARRGAPVLSGVDFAVEPGECVSLVGESGSGKTTLLRVLAGLQRPTQGTVELSGGRPQMVFQDAGASLTPWLSVGELLEDRVRTLGREVRRARVEGILARLGLPAEAAAASPWQLSGGQRQRVALARAVIEPPELLLCDEPISALDASLAATVLNLLGQLRRELGFAMVFVTHDLAAARLVADRIVVMTEGRLVEEGAAERVIGAPEHAYTRALLGALPVAAA